MLLFLDRWRAPYLFAVAGLTLFFGYHCLHLHVDEDNHSMDAENEGQSLVEDEFKKFFGEGDPILVAVHQDGGILNDSGKKLIREIGDELARIDGIEKVVSLAGDDFVFPDYLENLLISRDRKTTGIRIQLDDFSDNGESLSRVIDEIERVVKKHSTTDVKIALTGLPLQKHEAGRLVRRDQKIFSPLSFLILGGVLLLITKRWSGLFFPLLGSALTICWTLGIYSLFGYSLNMITSLLPPVIMTLSVTTAIHIYLEWLTGKEDNNRDRIVAAVRNLYRPCLFASLTTAIGFLSLLFSHTPAVKQFGIFAALGVVISYIIGVSGLAVGLSFLRKPPPVLDDPEGFGADHGVLSRVLVKISRLPVRHPRKIIFVTLLVAVGSAFGLQRVRSNTDLLRYLGTDTGLYRDTMFIDQNLTGVNTLEILVSRTDGEPLDTFDEMDKIQAFQNSIATIAHVKHSLSLADLLGTPEVEPFKGVAPFEAIIEELKPDQFLNDDMRIARVSVRTDAIGTYKGAELIEAIRSSAAEKLGPEYRIREAGGFYRVIAESNHLVATQIKSFAIAIVLILVAIGVVFRSFTFMGLAIIPNVIPLLMTAAIMGFFEIDLSTGTTMIASVVIGVAVDDTIHYLAAFRRSFRGDCDVALKKTTRLTGFALTSTTLALSIGFWVAIFGSFQPTVYFALLSGVTMWFALACDLLVLPACLKLAFAKKK